MSWGGKSTESTNAGPGIAGDSVDVSTGFHFGTADHPTADQLQLVTDYCSG